MIARDEAEAQASSAPDQVGLVRWNPVSSTHRRGWRIKWAPLLVIAVMLGACGGPPPAVSPPATTDNSYLKTRSQRVLDGAVNPDEPGCSAAVGVEGVVMWTGVLGIADLATNKKVTKDTVFDIGSVSKQFTATAVLLLVNEGRLTLDDPLAHYVPDLPDWSSAVTVAQLMHHTSGIPDYTGLLEDQGYQMSDRTTQAQALAAIQGAPELEFKPGNRFEYSNSNYLLLAEIVRLVSGKSLPDFLSIEIFRPLDLAMVVDPISADPDEAVSYGEGDTGNPPQFPVLHSGWEQVGDGAIQTTPSQLVLWADNYRTGKVGCQKLLDEQLAGAVETEPGSGDRYGAGIFSRANGTLDHDGSWAGFVTDFRISSDRRTSVAVSCNMEGQDPQSLADAIGRLWM
ncbi:D-alanyl-D-alanine carboxypeptidase precursor [Mycobacterium shottsii]|nr:serine hydrolase domain-containing protein [Mycobacterium shottsii]QYL28802.1 D-alanyl-D-alanine carboxypeptidase precursor [Mycobacterium shottsii]